MLTLVVTYAFPEASEAAAETFLSDLVENTRREPGCRLYEVFRAAETPRTFLIFEKYDDEAALEAHRASEHFQRSGKNGIQPIAERREAALYRDFA
jgi:quinol monooxygenase YgiN